MPMADHFRQIRPQHRFVRWFALLPVGLLGACIVRAPLEPLPTDLEALTFARVADHTIGGQWPEREWWDTFGDMQLGTLVEEALSANPDMEAARARLQAAEARAAAVRAPLVPSIDGTLGLQRSRLSEHGLFPPPLGGSSLWQNRASLDLHWEIDLWGRHRSALDGALRETEAARLERAIAELTLSTAVARRYVEWQRLEDQLDIGRRLLRQREELLALTQKRIAAGLDSNVQLRAAEAAVPDTRADMAALATQAAIARIELAALLGSGPDRGLNFARPSLSAPMLSSVPSLLPADLLARRPDVSAHRLRAEAAAARANAAQADFYPNINLAAAVGLDSTHFDNWLDTGSRFYNVGPAINLPLFGGGRRQATLDLRIAEYDAAVAAYRQTLSGAVRDVAAALTELRSLDGEARDTQAAVTAQTQSFELARRRYEGGLGTYADVLIAEASLLNQQRRIADLSARRLDASIRLIVALGGGIPAQTALTGAP